MKAFDMAPFALPNSAAGEFRFEETRDIRQIVIRFKERIPRRIGVRYLRDKWPGTQVEVGADLENPARFGWLGMDDWFNTRWQEARVQRRVRGTTVSLTFKGLKEEGLAEAPAGYNVDFRRTLGLQVAVPDWDQVRGMAIHTRSAPARSVLRVELDAGRKTSGERLILSGYNARITALQGLKGVAARGRQLVLGKGRQRGFEVGVVHMAPAHRYCGDGGLLEFALEHDGFTISLEALAEQGPIWYPEEGLFITRAADPTRFADYRWQHAGAQTINQRVRQQVEQSYARAYGGQPRPHAVAYSFGCKHSPQRYWLDFNGDVVLHKTNLTRVPGAGQRAGRFLNKGDARFFFGLETWVCSGRSTDPAPVPIRNLHFAQGVLLLEQQALCVPLARSILDGELRGDEITVALLRFRFKNAGDQPCTACLPVSYSGDSGRSRHELHHDPGQSGYPVPKSPLEKLAARRRKIVGRYRGRDVLRCACDTTMRFGIEGKTVVLRQLLQPGETCEAVLKIPYVALESRSEIAALNRLAFESCHGEVARFWRAENNKGSQLRSPVPQLDALYAAHLTHVEITDFSMPDHADLINTSVGTSTYGNFSNESCMIVQELDQRGFHEDARRRLDLWVKYQGTVPQPGNFTDCDGMYFGAGGFEQGNYNQHHGWVLWCLAEHFLLTGDGAWFARVAESVVAGADWVFRQRRQTLKPLPHSRGWERGFLPAGSLEDVTEFYYWLSTNCLSWRGVDTASRALETSGHPEAARLRREADAFGRDLVDGFENMRRHTPIVRLRDGRWVPHYPSRLYCRGRDQGWIREVLEGAVYLPISGLYAAASRQASWILDDFQDNLYLKPPYGYALRDEETNFFNRGGFSIQPCLLAGLLPHLERDEPEIYLWMLFNALASVFREEISGLIEHPMPELGFSNAVAFKTSDEANAVMWLRYMYVYWNQQLLHVGRALPRAWFAHDHEIGITRVSTYFGEVDAHYVVRPAQQRIGARIELRKPRGTPQVLVRFRHPQGTPIKAVEVDGARWTAFDAAGGDVDLTGLQGVVEVEALY